MKFVVWNNTNAVAETSKENLYTFFHLELVLTLSQPVRILNQQCRCVSEKHFHPTSQFPTPTTNCGPFIAYIFWRLFRGRSGWQKAGILKSSSDQHPLGIMLVPRHIILLEEQACIWRASNVVEPLARDRGTDDFIKGRFQSKWNNLLFL